MSYREKNEYGDEKFFLALPDEYRRRVDGKKSENIYLECNRHMCMYFTRKNKK